jgi:ubiquitin-like protein ATG12
MIVTIRLSPLPNTPQLRQPRFKCASHQRFEYIVRFLRKKLALKDHEAVFCYVNSVFAPGLDEGVGNLWRVRD